MIDEIEILIRHLGLPNYLSSSIGIHFGISDRQNVIFLQTRDVTKRPRNQDIHFSAFDHQIAIT